MSLDIGAVPLDFGAMPRELEVVPLDAGLLTLVLKGVALNLETGSTSRFKWFSIHWQCPF
jgi:hypothetical protein